MRGFRICARLVLALLAAIPAAVARGQNGVPALRLVESLKILGAEQDISANIPRVAVGPDGRIVVFNEPNAELVFFDSAGRKLGAFGRRGQGPGEFSGMGGGQLFFVTLGFLGDSVWAYEAAQRRYSLVSPDLKLLRTTVQPQFEESTVGAFQVLAVLPGDRLLGEVMLGRPVPYETNGVTRTWYEPRDSAIVIAGPDGKIEKRVAELPLHRSAAVTNAPGQYSVRPVPFRTAPLRDISDFGDRFVYVTHAVTSPNGGTYRVSVIRTAGDTAWTRTYPFTGDVITQRMKDSVVDAMIERSRAPGLGGRAQIPLPDEHIRFMRANMPSVRAPFNGVVLGADGTVWLRRYQPAGEPARYLVLGDRGVAVGDVTLPRTGMLVQDVRRDAVWIAERDADGFLNVMRYRVVR